MATTNIDDNLVSLGRFNSPTEGSLALARLEAEGIEATLGSDSTATWLNYLGPDLVGVELFVRQGDLAHAQEILHEARDVHHDEADADPDVATAWNDEEEEPAPLSPLIRAFRAAVIGWFALPPLLNFYSCWLIGRHRLWEEQDNWRFYAAVAFNLLGFGVAWYGWSSFFAQPVR